MGEWEENRKGKDGNYGTEGLARNALNMFATASSKKSIQERG